MKDPYRFPRTFDEAFRTATYASPVEHPPRRDRSGHWIVAIVIAMLTIMALWL